MKHSLNSLLLKYPAQVPRYTSYPTAPHFSVLPDNIYEEWLANIPQNLPLSLYFHIPYCSKLCWFCGCHTKITQKYGPVSKYLSLLHNEVEMVCRNLGQKRQVSHIHFGGGSPTILEGEDFSRLIEIVAKNFSILPAAEIAIEADPRGFSEAKVASYARSGVNRVSIGVQDFDPDVQAAINRIQPFRRVYDTVKLCRDYGINNISIDLVYGLPKQGLDNFRRTIDLSLLLNPDRIALFGYAHVPWKKKNMRLINENDLPDANARNAMFQLARHTLSKSGYMPIGLDHFARSGDQMAIAHGKRNLQRNFQGYTTDQSKTLIGFGASAIGSFAHGYSQNTPSIDEYEKFITAGKLAVKKGIAISDDDFIRRTIIESLMCYFEADIGGICKDLGFDISTFNDAFDFIKRMQHDGLAIINGSKIQVNTELPQVVRLACSAFDKYFNPGITRHAQVA